jgi:hypothetical protein
MKLLRRTVCGAVSIVALFAGAWQASAQPPNHWAETASIDYGIASDLTYGVFNTTPAAGMSLSAQRLTRKQQADPLERPE